MKDDNDISIIRYSNSYYNDDKKKIIILRELRKFIDLNYRDEKKVGSFFRDFYRLINIKYMVKPDEISELIKERS